MVSEYAYTPWGGRILLSGVNITDRGYTGHEHLSPFGDDTNGGFCLVNMNGRIYDPVLARFLSPDPYVQAPDFTQSFNRYAYGWNNPFKYTDPTGEMNFGLFYVSLNIGLSANGGLSLGISAGIGIENWASVGIGINYGFKGNNWSFTANGGLGGGYAYAGYDTKGGFISGAGYSLTSLAAPLSPISFNTNMTSVGIDYSQNGGLSGNFMGMSISKNGMASNPSVGVSLTANWGSEILTQDQDSRSQEFNIKTCFDTKKFPFANDNLLQNFIYDYIPINEYNIEGFTAYKNINQERAAQKKGLSTDGNGWIRDSNNKIKYGVTIKHYNGLNKPSYMIYLSRNPDFSQFIGTINHEITHAYIWHNNLTRQMGEKQADAFHESNAYNVGQGFVPDRFFRMYNGIVVPPHLISLPKFGPYLYRTW